MKPEPGIYDNVSFEDYVEWDAINNSRLGLMERSAAHYRANPKFVSTKAMNIGRLVHTGKLEPLSIADRYAVMPGFHLDEANVTKGGQPSTSVATDYVKQKVEEFKTANIGKELVSQDEYDLMRGMVDSLNWHQSAIECLGPPAHYELSICWEDRSTGLLCKARIDAKKPDRLTDLKTTVDAGQFEKAIARYGYHRQAAFYADGWEALTGESLPFWIVAIEKCEPFGVRAARMSSDAVDDGRERYRTLLREIENCLNKDEWPSYDDPDVWELPEWAQSPIQLKIGEMTLEV